MKGPRKLLPPIGQSPLLPAALALWSSGSGFGVDGPDRLGFTGFAVVEVAEVRNEDFARRIDEVDALFGHPALRRPMGGRDFPVRPFVHDYHGFTSGQATRADPIVTRDIHLHGVADLNIHEKAVPPDLVVDPEAWARRCYALRLEVLCGLVQ